MKQIMMKAKAGVTLVELLVVILIVTILSVSMLPLLKPFVVEAQYAAEAIPVIGNLRTKIGLYQYDKGKLPTVASSESGSITNAIETWVFATSANGNLTKSDTVTSVYMPAYRLLTSGATGTLTPITNPGDAAAFFGNSIDVDNQDLAGKRCKPVHFQYAVVANAASYCYAIGCFGDNNGLAEGTGYAVCEISVKGSDGSVHKRIGTWKRYKAATNGQLAFKTITSGTTKPEVDKKSSVFCPIPDMSLFASTGAEVSGGKLKMVEYMESYGWEF